MKSEPHSLSQSPITIPYYTLAFHFWWSRSPWPKGRAQRNRNKSLHQTSIVLAQALDLQFIFLYRFSLFSACVVLCFQLHYENTLKAKWLLLSCLMLGAVCQFQLSVRGGLCMEMWMRIRMSWWFFGTTSQGFPPTLLDEKYLASSPFRVLRSVDTWRKKTKKNISTCQQPLWRTWLAFRSSGWSSDSKSGSIPVTK